jgi:hypothetical protein
LLPRFVSTRLRRFMALLDELVEADRGGTDATDGRSRPSADWQL